MKILNNITSYPLLTILTRAGKRSFENLGKVIKKSGDTVIRMLRPGHESLKHSQKIAQQIFAKKRTLFLAIDETTIKKLYAESTTGIGWFYDTKIGRRILGFKLLVGAITDGKFTVPIAASFTFGKEFYPDPKEALRITIQYYIKVAQDLFPNTKIIVVLDGAYATVEFLKWALENNIPVEVRMHSNRSVEYEGEKRQLRTIEKIQPKGRQMARTVSVVWQGLSLWVTAVKRIDKHGEETIAYQAATYQAKPAEHRLAYKRRWGVEKLNRTTKQSLGLQESFSRKIDFQYRHICAVLLAYSILQLEMKNKGYENPEAALRALKKKNMAFLNSRYHRLDQNFDGIYA
jgi:DDE family transposase